MGDDADEAASPLPQGSERVQGRFHGLRIQGAEPFIEEHGFDMRASVRKRRQGQSQGKAHEEGFAAREIAGAAPLVFLPGINDVKVEV